MLHQKSIGHWYEFDKKMEIIQKYEIAYCFVYEGDSELIKATLLFTPAFL